MVRAPLPSAVLVLKDVAQAMKLEEGKVLCDHFGRIFVAFALVIPPRGGGGGGGLRRPHSHHIDHEMPLDSIHAPLHHMPTCHVQEK